MSENKTSKYFKYAIGEILLVMIGILLALQVNNWNSNRIDRAAEKKALIELKKGLELDQKLMQDELIEIHADVVKIKELELLLNNNTQPYHSDLDNLFGSVYGVRTLRLNTAFYEDLKASGLGLITDDDIRFQIVNLFEDNYSSIYEIFGIEWNVNEVTRPYYLKNFHDINFKISAAPNDFEKIWNDPYFKNIVNYRKICLESNQATVYERTIPAIQRLIEAINLYLNND